MRSSSGNIFYDIVFFKGVFHGQFATTTISFSWVPIVSVSSQINFQSLALSKPDRETHCFSLPWGCCVDSSVLKYTLKTEQWLRAFWPNETVKAKNSLVIKPVLIFMILYGNNFFYGLWVQFWTRRQLGEPFSLNLVSCLRL